MSRKKNYLIYVKENFYLLDNNMSVQDKFNQIEDRKIRKYKNSIFINIGITNRLTLEKTIDKLERNNFLIGKIKDLIKVENRSIIVDIENKFYLEKDIYIRNKKITILDKCNMNEVEKNNNIIISKKTSYLKTDKNNFKTTKYFIESFLQ